MYQTEFRPTEAQAICEMLATLASDGYVVRIFHTEGVTPDGEKIEPFVVEVIDPILNRPKQVVSHAKAYHLIDALTDAYQSTPERVAA